MPIQRSIATIAVWLFIAPFVCAQTPASAKPKSPELEQKAYALLEEVLTTIPTLKVEENRIRASISAADLLWPKDKKRARELFQQSGALYLQALNAKPRDDDFDEESTYIRRDRLKGLRRELVQSVAQRDARLALELIQATREISKERDDNPERIEEEQELERQLLTQLAKSDPQLALQKAEALLAQFPKAEMHGLIGTLMTKDKAAATQLTKAVLKNLKAGKSEDAMANNSQALSLFSVISGESLVPYPGAENVPADKSSDKPKPVTLDAAIVRETAEIIGQNFLQAFSPNNDESVSRNRLFWLYQPSTVKILDKYSPGIARQLQAKVAEFKRTANPSEKMMLAEMERMTSYARPTVETMLESAKKATGEERDGYYFRAAEMALEKGERDKAQQFGAEIKSRELREAMQKQLEQTVLEEALTKGEFENARLMIEKVRNPNERALSLIELAEQGLSKGRQKDACSLLDDARNLLTNRPTSRVNIEAQLKLAQAYATIAPEKASAMLEVLIQQLNEYVGAVAVLQRYEPMGFLQQDELTLSEFGGNLEVLTKHSLCLASLLATDADRVNSLFALYQRPEIRVMIQLKSIENVLSQEAIPKIDQAYVGPRIYRR